MLIDFRELFPRYNIKPKGVLHVGANRGEEAEVYLELGINDQVWIEANPNLMPILKQELFRNAKARCFNFAAGDQNKEVTLHLSNNGGQSSSILELGTHKTAHPEVYFVADVQTPMFRLDAFFRNVDNDARYDISNLDFLNIDIQGAELKALKGMGDLLHQFKWAYLEVNKEELYKGCALVGEVDSYMLGFGFKRIETRWCGNTGWGDALYIK